MTDSQKRTYVSNLYSGPKWKKRVEKMNDEQVVAIYLSHRDDGVVPDHTEEEPYFIVNRLGGPAEEALPVREISAPRDPHANEDQFPIY